MRKMLDNAIKPMICSATTILAEEFLLQPIDMEDLKDPRKRKAYVEKDIAAVMKRLSEGRSEMLIHAPQGSVDELSISIDLSILNDPESMKREVEEDVRATMLRLGLNSP